MSSKWVWSIANFGGCPLEVALKFLTQIQFWLSPGNVISRKRAHPESWQPCLQQPLSWSSKAFMDVSCYRTICWLKLGHANALTDTLLIFLLSHCGFPGTPLMWFYLPLAAPHLNNKCLVCSSVTFTAKVLGKWRNTKDWMKAPWKGWWVAGFCVATGS